MRFFSKVHEFAIFLIWAFFLSGASLAAEVPASSGPEQVRYFVAATADLHGTACSWDFNQGRKTDISVAAVAGAVRELRRTSGCQVSLIDAGDFLQGSPLSALHELSMSYLPNPMISAMNIAGYEFLVPGNHEFDQGRDYVAQAFRESNAPWIAANLTDSQGLLRVMPWYVKDLSDCGKGPFVGFIGFTSPGVKKWVDPDNVKGLDFQDILTSAQEVIPGLRQRLGLDALVAVIHGGMGPKPGHRLFMSREVVLDNIGYMLGHAFPDLDAVVMSHTHRRELEKIPGGALLIQPASHSRELALLDFTFAREGSAWRLERLDGRVQEIDGAIEPDKYVDWALEYRRAKTERMLSQPLCTLAKSYREEFAPLKASPALDLIHRVQLKAGNADVSLASSNFHSLSLSAGDFTLRQVFALYPYENKLVVLQMTGKDLREVLEEALGYVVRREGDYALRVPVYLYLTAQGVDLKVNPQAAQGSRITSIKFRGKALADDQVLRVAVNSYMANSGGTYQGLSKGHPVWKSELGIRDMLARSLAGSGILKLQASESIRIDNGK